MVRIQFDLMSRLGEQNRSLPGTLFPFEIPCFLIWRFGAIGVRQLFFSSAGDAFEKPNASKLGEPEKKLVELDPLGRLVAFPVGLQDPEKDHWIVSCSEILRERCRTDFKHKRTACLFCSLPGSPPFFDYGLPALRRRLPANTRCGSVTLMEEMVKSLTWFSRRYIELCLFRFLQLEANSGGKISEGRGTYVLCMMVVLITLSINGWKVCSQNPPPHSCDPFSIHQFLPISH